jgi:signal transduction histidine kinase
VLLPRVLRTASFRLATLYVLLFGASVVVLGAVVLLTMRSALEQQMKRRVEAEVAALTEEFRSGGLERLVASIRERRRGARGLDYLVLGPDGRPLAGNLVTPGGLGWVEVETRDHDPGERDRERVRALAVRLDRGVLLVVGDDLEHVEDADEAILRAFAWALGATAVLGIAGGLALSAGFLRRVDAITRTAEAIMDGDLDQRVPERGADDDLDRLASTLNRMLDRVADLMDGLRQVSSAVAHELRTPLARLRQRLEAGRSARSSPEREAAIDDALLELDAVLDTFGALLRIAQLEAGTGRTGFTDVDLGAIAESVVEAFGPAAEDAGKTLVAAIAPGAHVRGDRELLTQLLANLVENGIRHTPGGVRIEVGVAPTGTGARAVVADDGPGVPAHERERVLRRFQRLERSRDVPGTGLGLSLVAAIADLHGARIALEDNAPGLRVRLEFEGHRA